MSIRTRNSKTIYPIDLNFFTQEVFYPWHGDPLRLTGSEIGFGVKHLFKDSTLLGYNDDKICHQSMPRSQTCVVMKILHHMCVMSNEGLSSPIVLFKYDLLLRLRVSLSGRCCLDGTSIPSFDLLPFVLLPRVSQILPHPVHRAILNFSRDLSSRSSSSPYSSTFPGV